ncbi:MAG: hypothetical protein AAF581_04140 [Planctomycetota bacterium]
MQRIVLIVIVGAVVWFGGCLVVDWLQSDEDRIKACLQEICESFNTGSARGFVERLTDDYDDRDHGLSRAELRTGLNQYFVSTRMDGKGGLVLRAEIEAASIVVTFDESDPTRAHAAFRAAVYETESEQAPVWTAEFSVGLRDVDGDWLVSSTDYETLTGRQPLRF